MSLKLEAATRIQATDESASIDFSEIRPQLSAVKADLEKALTVLVDPRLITFMRALDTSSRSRYMARSHTLKAADNIREAYRLVVSLEDAMG